MKSLYQRHLITKSIALIAFIMLGSCSNSRTRETDMKEYFKAMLKDVDKVEIQYFSESDTLIWRLTQADSIDVYKKLIDGSIDVYRELSNGNDYSRLESDRTGRLLYFVNGDLYFHADLSTKATGSKRNVGVIEYSCKPDVYQTLLTSQEEMNIDGYFRELMERKRRVLQNDR